MLPRFVRRGSRRSIVCLVFLLALLILLFWALAAAKYARPAEHLLRGGADCKESSGSSSPFSTTAPAILAMAAPGRRKKRIVIYARYSTEEQNPRSIDDQFLKCRQFIKERGFTDVEITEESDAGISGVRRNRPGIDRVVASIESGGCDIVVAEELSRFYRKTSFANDLFARAVDASVRVLTVTDGIDTDDERWRVLAPVHSIVSEIFLQQTSARIRRSADGRWAAGYAVNPLLPGYRRNATHPNAEDRRQRGPFRDEKDERWTPVIREAFERAARGENYWRISNYLNARKLPLPVFCRLKEWTELTARRWLAQPMYAGFEEYRRTLSRPSERSGESRKIDADEEQILRRDVPHLAHIPRWLWERVQTVMEERARRWKKPKGVEHPLTGITRDRRGPLSTLFHCGICGARMHSYGKLYRCSCCLRLRRVAHGDRPRCWNRSAVSKRTAHAQLGAAIVEVLFAHAERFSEFCRMVAERLQEGDGQVRKTRDRLRRDMANLDNRIARLVKAIESSGDLEKLTHSLREREAERRQLELELERLEECDVTQIPVPTHADIRRMLEDLKPQLLEKLDAEAGAILRQLIPRIEAHPYRAFDSQRRVARAHFTMNLLQLLPMQLQQVLVDRSSVLDADPAASLSAVSMVVDLFERPLYLSIMESASELLEQGHSTRHVSKRLGVSDQVVQRAVAARAAMKAQGLTDPYIQLRDEPNFYGRWPSFVPENGNGDSASEGKAARSRRKSAGDGRKRSCRPATGKNHSTRKQRRT